MASKNISFDTIPASIRKPGKYFEHNTRLAVRTLPTNRQRMLVVGQMLASGSKAAGVPVAVYSDAQAADYFGAGSIVHHMARAAIAANPYLDLTCVALADAEGVAATGSILVSGIATEGGLLQLNLGMLPVMVNIVLDDTAAMVAGKIVASWGDPNLPVSAALDPVTPELVILTAKTPGEAGNLITVEEGSPPPGGVALQITPMSGGSGSGIGIAAAGSVTVTGTAAGSGAMTLYLGNQRVETGVAAGDQGSVIAAGLMAALAKIPDLPVTAQLSGAAINFTAKNKGTMGNQIRIDWETSCSGVSASVSAMSGGAVDPEIDAALAAVYAEQYHIVVAGLNTQTALTVLRDHLDNVSGAMEQRPGRGVYSTTGALAEATTLAGLLNSGRLNHAYLRATRSLPCEMAAGYGAVMAYEEDPAMPLNTLEVKGIHAPAIDQRLSRAEQESCLYNGVSPLEVGPGERVQIVRAITTYTVDPQGIDDISLLDTTTIATLDYVRKACRERIALRFPRAKLSSRTPAKVRTELLDVLLKLEELEIVEEVMANSDGLVVERDLQDPSRLDAKIPCDVVNGLHVFAGRIDLLL